MNEVPYVSDELMDKIDKLFAHGEQRAKSHDQRFGQWLVNKIRIKYPNADATHILFMMENPELLEMVKDYND